jgi:ribosomal protein S27E
MQRLTERKWTSKDNTQAKLVLENCAHCGGVAEFVGTSKVAIKCHVCGMTTPYFELKTQAVAVWNKRVREEDDWDEFNKDYIEHYEKINPSSV